MHNYPGNPYGQEGTDMLTRMNDSHAGLRRFGMSLIEFRPGMVIMEVGCGGGSGVLDLLEAAPESHVLGIDFSETSIELAKKVCAEKLGKGADLQLADVTDLPFENDSFDLVTAVETIYFWNPAQAGADEVFRVLKPGGVFVVMNDGYLPSILDEWMEIKGYFYLFRPEELEALLKKAGFSKVDIHYGEKQNLIVIGTK